MLLNLLNPKAALFFIAVLPAYISAEASIMPQLFALSASYVAIASAVHVIIVLLAGQAHHWLSNGARQRVVRRWCALFLAAIAFWFLISTR
jgi:threonine/homoserine/homoserine lactone efflux protein